MRIVPCFLLLQCYVPESWLIVPANSLFVLVSMRFVRVSVVRCVVEVFVMFLILRLSGV